MKNLKKLLTLFLILSLVACMAFTLVSCGDDTEDPDENGTGTTEPGDDDPNEDGKTAYTVTVKDKSGNALSGVKVQLLLDNVVPMGNEITTGADGKAVFSIKAEEGEYYAKVKSVPEAYELPTATVKLVNNAATVELESIPLYTVYIKDASGNAIEGAAVQICSVSSGACQLPKVTDSEGKIASYLKSDDYKAKVVSAPAGYTYTEDYFNLVNGTVTIVLAAE